jgi:hypothetical protein
VKASEQRGHVKKFPEASIVVILPLKLYRGKFRPGNKKA